MINFSYFEKIIDLAFSVKNIALPNPAVGAIIVKNNKIISIGKTNSPGKDHAEAEAIKLAGKKAKGADLYVTLEPCIEFPGKRTPSCAKAIQEAGIKNVYIGMIDPNPYINGKGIEYLKTKKINTILLDSIPYKLYELYEDYIKITKTNMPFITAKYAMTLDGNIASDDYSSKWISNEKSRNYVHFVRSVSSSILVGIGTVLRDNPELTARYDNNIYSPLRIIIDPDGLTDENKKVLIDNYKTVFIVKNNIDSKFINLINKYNKDYIKLDIIDNRFDFKTLFSELRAKYGISNCLIEGGSKILHSVAKQDIIDKLLVFIAPKLILGSGIPPFQGKPLFSMENSYKLKKIYTENIDNDVLIKGYFHVYE